MCQVQSFDQSFVSSSVKVFSVFVVVVVVVVTEYRCIFLHRDSRQKWE